MAPPAQTLVDVNLQRVSDDLFTGTWHVVDKVLNRADPAALLAQITALHLGPDYLQLDTPTSPSPAVGSWHVERDALLSRPYLLLQLAQDSVRALVTRVRHALDGTYRMMVLYFQSGLELFLAQSN